MTIAPENYAAALAEIESRYPGSVVSGDTLPDVKRVSTGSLELDYATGGGIPIGRWSRFMGGFSSGKSLTCWNVIKKAQEMGMSCAYYNIEKQYDRAFVERRGVNTKNLVLVQGNVMEDIGKKMEALLGSVHLHVIDSTNSAVALDELSGNLEDWHRGLGARVWGKVMRRVLEHFDEDSHNGNIGIMVSQMRDSFGYGGGEETTGGRFLEYTSSLTLHFKRGKWLFYDDQKRLQAEGKNTDTLSGGAEADGMEINCRVTKSRVCQPFRQAMMRIDFKNMEWDRVYELAKAARYFNVVEETSKGRFLLPGGEKAHGMPALSRCLAENADLALAVENKVRGSW